MRRLSGSSNWFSFANLTGSPSSTSAHALFAVCATPTLPVAGNEYRVLSIDCSGSPTVAAAIRINDAGGVVFSQKDAAGSTVYSYTHASVFSASSAPHTLALVYDGANCIAYVDGTQVNSAPATLGARAAFATAGSQSDGVSSSSFDVGGALLFTQALTAAQVRTLGRARVPTSIDSSKVQGWWAYRTGRPAIDLSKFKQNLTGTSAAGAPDERWVGDMRRAKVFLPQYLLQPPIVAYAPNRTNIPNAALTSSAVVASTASSVTNAPNATLSASMGVASAASAVTNAPNANVAAGMAVASVAQNVTNIPSVTLLNAPAVASTSSNVTNIPSATLAPNYPVVSTCSVSTNCPSASITAAAPVACVSSTVTDCPSASITGGLGAVALTVTNIPPAALDRNLPAISAANSVTNATAAIGSGMSPGTSTASAVTNAPTAAITASGVVASTTSFTVTNAPPVSLTAAATVAAAAASVTNCPSVVLSATRQVVASASNVTNCPPANIVPALFPPVAAFGCTSRSDCPPTYLFQSITLPPNRRRREWPPRLR